MCVSVHCTWQVMTNVKHACTKYARLTGQVLRELTRPRDSFAWVRIVTVAHCSSSQKVGAVLHLTDFFWSESRWFGLKCLSFWQQKKNKVRNVLDLFSPLIYKLFTILLSCQVTEVGAVSREPIHLVRTHKLILSLRFLHESVQSFLVAFAPLALHVLKQAYI